MQSAQGLAENIEIANRDGVGACAFATARRKNLRDGCRAAVRRIMLAATDATGGEIASLDAVVGRGADGTRSELLRCLTSGLLWMGGCREATAGSPESPLVSGLSSREFVVT